MHDIFITHARADDKLAEALYEQLTPEAKCFLDVREVRPGDDWDRVVAQAQRKSAMTVVIVTASSDDAYYEREEVAAAISFARAAVDSHRVIPLLVNVEGGAPPLMPYGLRLKHAISISGEHEIPQAAKIVLETLTATRESQKKTSTQAASRAEDVTHDEKQRPVQFAFLAAFDIKNFSRFNADQQVTVYTTLQLAISDALAEVELKIARTSEGTVFWSQGGDGGILSQISGEGSSIFRLALLTASLLRSRIASSPGLDFDIVAALDCGLVYIRSDLNGAPNIWGVPPNRVHRALEACEPGELLASGDFVRHLQSQTDEFDDLIGPRRMRATKQVQLLEVHRILTDVSTLVPQSGEPIDIVDFEAPNRSMVQQYRILAHGAAESRSGVWSLLLARRRRDLRDISDAEYRRVVTSVSRDRQARRKPHHELFSLFSGESLIHLMEAGTFRRLDDGDELCHAGDDAHEMYIVAEGRIEVVEDDMTVVARGPGELVGEMALVDPVTRRLQSSGMLRSASLVAGDHTTVFAIPYAALLEGAHDIASTLVGYYERRRNESILTGDDTLKPVLKLLSRDDCDSLLESAFLYGTDPATEPDFRVSPSGLVVAGKGVVMLRADDGSERTLQEARSKPILVNADRQEATVHINAVGDSEFTFLDGETWASLRDMAKDHSALPQLTANVETWDIAAPSPTS
jgi:CRP-like cAMP-binding protein